MNAAKDNDIRAGLGRLLRKSEGIADVIRDVLDFRHLIIMGEDDCIQLFLERDDVAGKRVQPGRRNGLAERKAIHASG